MIDKETLQARIAEARQEQQQVAAHLSMLTGKIIAYEALIAELDADNIEENEEEACPA